MKKLVLLIFSLFAFYFSKAQIINNVTQTFRNGIWVADHYLGVDSAYLFNAVDTTFKPLYPGLVYRAGDNSLYFWNTKSWASVGSSKIDTVQTISQLELYNKNANANLLFVTDSLRGGLFYYSSIGIPDGGICFPATGKITGYWIRVFNQANGVNVAWFGANPYDKLADDSYINSALNSPYNNGKVNISQYPGNDTLFLGGSIYMPSNMSLIVGLNTHIALMNNVNKEMIRSKDTVGDVNIKVYGGNWFGNGFHQAMVIGGSANNTFYGPAFTFIASSNVEISNVQIDTTLNYYLYFSGCNNVFVHNCKFYSAPPGSGTQDGSACGFSGDGFRFEDNEGYTNDDFISLISGTQGLLSIMMTSLMQSNTPTTNIYINNIYLQNSPSNGATPYSLFGAWVQRYSGNPNGVIGNVYVNNIHGNVLFGYMRFGDYYQGKAYFDNININNVQGNIYGSFDGQAMVWFGDVNATNLPSYFNSINISNCNVTSIYNTQNYKSFIQVYKLANISSINISDCSFTENNPSQNLNDGTFFLDNNSTSVQNVNMSNCTVIDSSYGNKYMYSDYSVGTSITHVNFSNCYLIGPGSATQSFAIPPYTGQKFDVNGTSMYIPQSSITYPQAGDIIKDPTNGIEIYNNGRWQSWLPNLITSPISGQILQYNGTNWINWTSNYLTGNQNITLSGDVTGSGTTAITTSLKSTGTAGNYTRITFDAQGRETSGTDTAYAPLTGGSGYIQNQYAAAQPASWWVQGQTRTDGGTFNLTGLGNGKLISTSTLNLTDTGSYANPAAGIGMYAFNSGTELDNPHSITLSGGVNQIAGLRSDISLNSSDSTTWLNSDAGSAVTGLLGVIRAFNNGKYGVVGAVGALAPFTFTQAPYTAFTGHIDTAAQVLLYKQTDVANNIDSKIGTPFGILQLSPYPNSFNGGLQMPIVNISANYTATTSNYSIRCTAALTLTLPPAASCPNQIYHIVSTTGAVTVTSFNNLSNVATTSIAAGSAVELQSDGTNWNQIGN